MSQSPRLPRVGVIGLGAMGFATASALLEAGLAVTGCDRNPATRDRFAEAGGAVAPTAAEAAADVDVLLLLVVNADQVEQVLFGPDGAVGHLRADGVVMQCATVPPSYAQALDGRLEEAGLRLLDAPVSGGTVKARAGKLSVMASGGEAAFAAAEPVLEAMADTVHRLGDRAGPGSSVKLVNQLLAGVHIASAAEAMALGIRMGIDPHRLYEVITRSAGNSWMFENRVPHILAGDYTPHSAVSIFVKDLGIVADTGRELGFPVPVAGSALQQFLAATAAGHGREDDAAVIKVYERLAGIALPKPANDG